ncbi:MAG TPA: HAD family hydrolase, partial [Hyphomicrobium sp.]|nr:HAD family hydrolase [Hyphomicrobium sp.]
EAARAAGIDFAAVTWGYTAPERLRTLAPNLIFERIEDIGAHLLPR